MSLPRFAMPEDDDDSTAPAQFLLKLPPSYAQKLAALSTPTPSEWALSTPVIAPTPPAAARPRVPARLVVWLASAAVAVAIVAGVGGALAQSSGGPVGISKRAPKKLAHVVRSSERQAGVARAHAPAVSVESLQHHHAKAKAKRKR